MRPVTGVFVTVVSRTMASTAESFFTLEHDDDGEWVVPTDLCRGPWDPDACHAGPPTGMLARAAERLLPEQRLARITVDLIRPIPHAGFRVVGETTRTGRTVSTTHLSIVDAEGRIAVNARTLHMTPQAEASLPTTTSDTPRLADAVPGVFPIESGRHGLPMFSSAVEMRYPAGQDHRPGPTTAWMRTVPLLADEEVAGFARICPLADCGNAISRNAEPGPVAFLNTDLTVVLHREPVGEWFGMQSESHWQADGFGMSDSLLFDDRGPVGRALQCLVIQTA
jgi:hypothetical protein